MNLTTKLAALTPVTVAVVGLTQFHYVVSHLSSIAEVAAAVTVGAGIWAGKSISGKRAAARQAQMDTPGQADPLIGQFVNYSLPVADPVAATDWDRVVREARIPVQGNITRR